MSIDALSPGGAIDATTTSSHDDDSTRLDEMSDLNPVWKAVKPYRRWFIRHGRHVRDSAVGQCVFDATSGHRARFIRCDSMFDAFVRSFVRRVDVGAAIGREAGGDVDRSARRDRRNARPMDARTDREQTEDKEAKRSERERLRDDVRCSCVEIEQSLKCVCSSDRRADRWARRRPS